MIPEAADLRACSFCDGLARVQALLRIAISDLSPRNARPTTRLSPRRIAGWISAPVSRVLFPQMEFSARRRTTSQVPDRLWILDPIDGTYSFVQSAAYGVLIGLEISEPVLESSSCPRWVNALRQRGLGCFWNDEPARVSTTASLPTRCCWRRILGNCEPHGRRRRSARLRPLAAYLGRCLRTHLVATGRADIMLDPS
jgi:3'-phosphoadenosine 5'-phosphosulfate (PAPS) 3'-phosphatase